MKTKQLITIIGLLITIYSYGQLSNRNGHSFEQKRNIQTMSEELSFDDNEEIDSLRLDKILKDALKIAKQNIFSKSLFIEYDTASDDSSFVATVNISFGYLFSINNRHLLIRRLVPWGAYLNLYLITGNDFIPVIYREQCGMTYINDTIRDVNGDGLKDFLVHWYPSSGCCKRDIFNVYLNKGDNGTFTNDYEFINPTFSTGEKIIRGVKYGHPGEVELYKYKWNGFRVDTVEFIYPIKVNGQNRTYIKTNKLLYSKGPIKKIKLKKVPKEYHKIDGYDLFTGEGY